ncbi:MAG: response regulator [Algicola sp.]|nr:response regulator [Algicola sp.]
MLLTPFAQAAININSPINSPINTKAVTGKYTIEKPYTELISRPNGINLGWVRTLVRSDDGYLWLGADAGLVRFDGYDAKVFAVGVDPQDAVKPHVITDIVEGKAGESAVVEGEVPDLWVLTQYSGLYRFNPVSEKFEVFLRAYLDKSLDKQAKKPFSFVYLTKLNKDTLLIGSTKGLIEFDINTHEHHLFTPDPDGKPMPVKKALADVDGNLWMSTSRTGVYRRDAKTGEITQFKHIKGQTNSVSSNYIVKMWLGEQGKLWLATPKGANVIDLKTSLVTRLGDDDSKINEALTGAVAAISEDKQGNVWFNSINHGLIKYDQQRQKYSLHGRMSDYVFSLLFDDTQLLWVATNQGLMKVDLQSMAFKTLTDGPPADHMLLDNHQTAWIRSGALARFDEKALAYTLLPGVVDFSHIVAHDNKLIYSHLVQGNFMSTLDIDSLVYTPVHLDFRQTTAPPGTTLSRFDYYQGDIYYLVIEYMPTDDYGLYKYDSKTGQSSLLKKHLVASAMLMDSSAGQILFATRAGLLVYDIKTGTTENVYQNQGVKQQVRCLSEEPGSNNIWVCLDGRGLGLYDKQQQTMQVFAWTDSKIRTVISDDKGDVWMGTTDGVLKFDVTAKTFKPYRQLSNTGKIDFSRAATLKLPSGAVMMGAGPRLLYFNPKDLVTTPRSIQTKITELKVLNKVQKPQPGENAILSRSISHTDKITLTQQDYLFSLSFASLAFRSTDFLQYAYKLEGLDNDWIYVDASNRVATYTTLPAGDYTFRVKGTNSEGQWNEGSKLDITVLAPWWATTTAYVIYVVLFVTLFGLMFYFRTKTLQQRAQSLTLAVEQRTGQLQRETEKVNALLEEKDQLLLDKDRLITNISHEFRTPLTLILGPLENQLQQTQSEQSKGLLSLAKANGQRLLAMIDQLLDIARVKDHANQTRQLIEVGATSAFLTESYRSLADFHQITLTLDNRLNGAAYLNMLPDSLEKILSNLLSNAFKYTSDGESIDVSLCICDENQLQLTVRDTGEGISETDQQQIFERFTRVYNNSKYVPGAGIGLALVKELIDAHLGSITLKSQLSVGSEFVVLLPLSQLSHDEDSFDQNAGVVQMNQALMLAKLDEFDRDVTLIERPQPSQDTDEVYGHEGEGNAVEGNSEQKPQVLVIEDNPEMRNYILDCLSTHYQCTGATDGEMGIEMAQNNLPDLIISDVMMPKKDGFEVTRTLKQNDMTNHIPIILLTAHADEQTRLQGWHEKADEFLEKPFNTHQLISRIDNLLSVRALLSQRYQRALTSISVDHQSKGAKAAEAAGTDANSNTAHDAFFEQVNRIFEAHYGDEAFGVKVFAEKMNASPRTVVRKMKTLLNIKPNEALRIFRLRKAAELLNQGEMPSIVAVTVGFSSHSYFAQCFKAHYGCMPSDYA